MTFCKTCGKPFGNIAESRLHQAACNGETCSKCNGTGTEPGTERTACMWCDGRGTVEAKSDA